MTKYKVKVIHVFNEIIDIEAESEEKAREATAKLIESDSFEPRPLYETTFQPENWPVITEEEFNQIVSEQVAKENKN